MPRSSSIAGTRPTVIRAIHPEMASAPASALPARAPRRFPGWLSALLADGGVSARFATERRRDEDLVRRVERRRQP
jgi:hypothetical protein